MNWLLQSRSLNLRSAGFSLIELVIVMTLTGILMAIAAPGWLSFWQQRLLTAGQDQAFMAMKTAQDQARLTRIRQTVEFRNADAIEWSVHPASTSAARWYKLPAGITIDATTTLGRSGAGYAIQFDEAGHVSGQLGRLILSAPNTTSKRCVFTSTLLGVLRKAEGSSCD